MSGRKHGDEPEPTPIFSSHHQAGLDTGAPAFVAYPAAAPMAAEEKEMKEINAVKIKVDSSAEANANEVRCSPSSLLIAREAASLVSDRHSRQRNALTSQKGKEIIALKRQIIFFLVSVLASVIPFSRHGSSASIPEPLQAIFFPMEYAQNALVSQTNEEDAYLLRFIARHMQAIMLFGFAVFAAWLGFHGTRSTSKYSLEMFKTIMAVWCIVATFGAFFTTYAWTFMPVFEELLPRCDAQDVCMPFGSDTVGMITQDCILRSPVARPRLPNECAWVEDYFLVGCTKPNYESNLAAWFLDENVLGDELMNSMLDDAVPVAVVDSPRSRRLPSRKVLGMSGVMCEINRPLMQEYHELIDNFAIYLARAIVCLWTILFTMLLNAVSSFSCIYLVYKFQHLQQLQRRQSAREAPLRCSNPSDAAERRAPLLTERTALMV